MHCVYKITFTDREEKGIYPCYYIGSKANCEFVNGKLYQVYPNGNIKTIPYWGSSRYKDYNKIIETEEKSVEVIQWFDIYEDCLLYEKEQHIINDVVKSSKYFNKNIASENLNSVDMVVCKHTETGKIIRLHKDHELLKDGTYVGVNKGKKHTEEFCKQNKRHGDKSFWYGKQRSEETKEKIRLTKLEKSKNDPEYYSKIAKKNKDRCLGVKMPEEYKEKVDTVCAYCNRVFKKSAHTRWHGEKCKQKPKDNNLSSIIEE